MKKHPQEELLMTVQATPAEVIAMNAIFGFFRRHGQPLTPEHHLFCLLGDQYLKRLNAQLPPEKSPLLEQYGGTRW